MRYEEIANALRAEFDAAKVGVRIADLLFLFRIKYGLHAVLARMEAEADWLKMERSWRP